MMLLARKKIKEMDVKIFYMSREVSGYPIISCSLMLG